MTDGKKERVQDQPRETQENGAGGNGLEGFEELADVAKAALGEETDEATQGADADASPDNAEAIAVLIDGLKGENAELKEKYLRLAADMDNLRRRTERDVKDARAYAIANFARDMLAVSDNLRRALEAIPDEQREGGDAGFKSLVEGVEMTERSMLSALERHGVRKQEPKGARFDPNFHQAMFEVPDTEVPNNTVVQVVQDGYVIGERVLRPAMVGVSKGGPKQPQAADDAAPKTAGNDNGAAGEDAEPGPPNPQSEKDA